MSPGDAIRYRTRGFDHSDGIFSHIEDGRVYVSAWNHTPDVPDGWVISNGNHDGEITGCPYEPHPDADLVLAEYTAWRLLNG